MMNRFYLVTSIYRGEEKNIIESHTPRKNYREAKSCFEYTIMQKKEGFELIGLYITKYVKNKQKTYDCFLKYELEDNNVRVTRRIDTRQTHLGVQKIPR